MAIAETGVRIAQRARLAGKSCLGEEGKVPHIGATVLLKPLEHHSRLLCCLNESSAHIPDNVESLEGQRKRWKPNALTRIGFVSDAPMDRFDGCVWRRIFAFVGAHILEWTWLCPECKPSWTGWHCDHCDLDVNVLEWTPDRHFGHCGESCPCCRFELGAHGACFECLDLWILKGVSHGIQETLRSYNGRWEKELTSRPRPTLAGHIVREYTRRFPDCRYTMRDYSRGSAESDEGNEGEDGVSLGLG